MQLLWTTRGVSLDMKVDVSRTITPPDGPTVPLQGYALPAAVPFVSVADLVRGLHHRWRLWLTTAIGGLMAAIAMSLAFPPPHSATTTLLLRHSTEVDATRAMKTDSELVKSRTVAQDVIDRLGLDLTPDELISDVSVAALSDFLLQITTYGSTADEAVLRAEALAGELLRFRRDEFERQAQVVIDLLEERRSALSAESLALTERIDSFDRGSNISNLSDLLTRRNAVATELSELRQRVDEIRIDTASAVANSRIVDPASEADRSPLKAMASNLLAGIVGGLVLGTGWVVGSEVVSDRVRRRQDVMLSLRAPVAVSLGPLRGPLWAQRARFRRHLAKPRPDITQAVRHLRSLLARGGAFRPALVAVSVTSDGPAALFVASTAVELVREGKNVLVVDLSRHSALAALLEVRATRKTATVPVEGTESKLWVTSLPSTDLQDAREDAELETQPDSVLVLATLDPALGAWHLPEWADTAVTVATAGRSTATALQAAAQMIRGAGLELVSAVLVGAGPSDETLGIPENLSTRVHANQ